MKNHLYLSTMDSKRNFDRNWRLNKNICYLRKTINQIRSLDLKDTVVLSLSIVNRIYFMLWHASIKGRFLWKDPFTLHVFKKSISQKKSTVFNQKHHPPSIIDITYLLDLFRSLALRPKRVTHSGWVSNSTRPLFLRSCLFLLLLLVFGLDDGRR